MTRDRKPMQFTVKALLITIAACAALLSWAATCGGPRVVAGFAAVMLTAGVGILLECLGASPFGFSYASASMGSLVCIALSYCLHEEFHGYLLLSAAALLGLVWLSSTIRGWSRWSLLQQAAGFTWGFLISLALVVSIQNGRVSVIWDTMLPALVLIPFAVFIPIVPFWAVRRWLKTAKQYAVPASPDACGGPEGVQGSEGGAGVRAPLVTRE